MSTVISKVDAKTNPPERPGVLELIAPFWVSEQRWRAWPIVAILLAGTFGGAYVSLWANRLLGEVTDALIGRQWDVLWPALVMSALAAIISTTNTHGREALQNLLELRWRTWLTAQLLREWSERSVFYDIEREGLLSNADQRIADDVRLFVENTLNIVLHLISVVVNAVTYIVLLWQLSGVLSFMLGGTEVRIPGYMVYLAVLYALCSFLLAHWMGKALVGLNMRRQSVEGDFRYGAMQWRENAEQIAFYGGGPRERQRLEGRFEHIRHNTKAIILRTFKLKMSINAYGAVFAALPTLGALPRYLAGEITFGMVTRIVSAFHGVTNTLSYFTQVYANFTEVMAQTNRLRDLVWAMRKAQRRPSGFTLVREQRPDVASGTLQLRTPVGELLAGVAPLSFAPGQRWLVQGPSGAGKSTLLRALAGLWPHGAGQVRLPAAAQLMFLPQRSYIPVGTLKEALCYPSDPAQFDDDACRQALECCGLAVRGQSLSEHGAWQQTLSGGEQQRLAFARVLLHQPAFIFLDEATSALDEANEALLYQAVITQLPDSAVVSVAHKSTLTRFHQHTLELAPAANRTETAS